MKGSWLDRSISYVSPQAGARRAKARLAERTIQEISARKYDGASVGRRTDNWKTTGSSANAEVGPAISRLRNRCRDLGRNNTYANRAIKVLDANIIGTGIIPQAKAVTGSSAKNADSISHLWSEWGETLACDADGLHNFYGLQSLAVRTIMEGGECLIRRYRRPKSFGLPVPLQYQVLEGDFIDTTKEGLLANGNFIVQGVEFDKYGRRVAYWLFEVHPGDTAILNRKTFVSNRISADDILHLFEVGRPGQVRGVPRAASCVVTLRDFDEYQDAQLVKQKIAACFTAFIHDIQAPEVEVSSAEDAPEQMEPGAIENLPSGKTITFPSPPQIMGYKEFSDVSLHAVAMGYGVTYEALTGDLSGVNFSSGRMGWIEFNRQIEQTRWLTLIPRLCQPTYNWFREAVTLMGYDGAAIATTWTPPRREMIDPVKETKATAESIRSGLTTLSEAIRQQGNDPDAQFKEMKSDNDKLDALGLIIDTDPRQPKKKEQQSATGDLEE